MTEIGTWRCREGEWVNGFIKIYELIETFSAGFQYTHDKQRFLASTFLWNTERRFKQLLSISKLENDKQKVASGNILPPYSCSRVFCVPRTASTGSCTAFSHAQLQGFLHKFLTPPALELSASLSMESQHRNSHLPQIRPMGRQW